MWFYRFVLSVLCLLFTGLAVWLYLQHADPWHIICCGMVAMWMLAFLAESAGVG